MALEAEGCGKGRITGVYSAACPPDLHEKSGNPSHPANPNGPETERWTPSFGQENAEIKLGSQVLRKWLS